MSKKLKFISLFIIIFASIRGILVYHFSFNVNVVYSLSATCFVLLGLFSSKYILFKNNNDRLAALRNAIFYNYIFIGIYSLFYISFIGLGEIGNIYLFLLFPVIFLLIKFEIKYLELAIHVISICIIIGTYIFYQLGIDFGFDAIESANLILRPGELSYARIGENLLPGGYLGSHHDNANILIMSTTFYFSKAVASENKHKYIFWLFFFTSATFTILTGSASNIIALFIVLFFGIIFYSKKLLLLIIPFLIYNYQYIEKNLYFLEKIKDDQSELDSGGIYNSLNLNSALKSLHSIVIGGGNYFHVPMMRSEVAFIKILISYGFIPFVILMFILFSPLYYCYLFNKKFKITHYQIPNKIDTKYFVKIRKSYTKELILAALPILTGTISLLHYGSLFRITSIGLFCILLAIFYKKYLELDNKINILV